MMQNGQYRWNAGTFLHTALQFLLPSRQVLRAVCVDRVSCEDNLCGACKDKHRQDGVAGWMMRL